MPRTTGVVLTRSERIPPRPSGPAPIAVAVLVVVAHLGLLASAVLGLPVAFAVLAVACTALEPVAERVVPLLPWALSRSLLTLPWRWAVSVAALLCLMTVRSFDEGVLAGAVLVAAVVLGLSAAVVEGFAEVVGHLRKSPVLTRNITVTGLTLPPHPRWLLTLRARLLTPSHVLLVVAPALAVSGRPPGRRGDHAGGAVAPAGGGHRAGRRAGGGGHPPPQPPRDRARRGPGGDRPPLARAGAVLRRRPRRAVPGGDVAADPGAQRPPHARRAPRP